MLAAGGRSIRPSIQLIAARRDYQLHTHDRSARNQRHSLCAHPSINFADCMGTIRNCTTQNSPVPECTTLLFSLPTSPFSGLTDCSAVNCMLRTVVEAGRRSCVDVEADHGSQGTNRWKQYARRAILYE